MKKRFSYLVLFFALQISYSFAQSNLNYPGRYMGRDEVKTITAPNGAVADAGFAQTLQLIYPQPTIVKEADGIWVLGGYSITNVVVIETAEGLIIIDSGDSEEEGINIKEGHPGKHQSKTHHRSHLYPLPLLHGYRRTGR